MPLGVFKKSYDGLVSVLASIPVFQSTTETLAFFTCILGLVSFRS